MNKIMRPVIAEVDLDKIEYNIKNIVKISKGKEVIAVVKADAYGHGALDLVPVLLENGVKRLAVAVITEAIELRHNKIDAPIMILGFTPLDFSSEMVEYNIEQTVYDLDYAIELSKFAVSNNAKIKVHIALDTGMGRIGFIPDENSLKKVKQICKLEGLEVIGLFTHFSTSDEKDKEYTHMQLKKIKDFNDSLIAAGINIPLKHVSNSGAILDMPETFMDAVRAGIILYGYYPSDEVNKKNLDLKPALTLKTKVCHVKELEEGMYVSYGRTYKTEKKTIIATLPIGYADGYSRALSNNGKVIINGHFANIVGRVCMDQCMVDVTDIPNVKVSDEVILLGEQGDLKYNADDMAKDLGTINYEVLCMIKQRIPRVYIRNGRVQNVRNYL